MTAIRTKIKWFIGIIGLFSIFALSVFVSRKVFAEEEVTIDVTFDKCMCPTVTCNISTNASRNDALVVIGVYDKGDLVEKKVTRVDLVPGSQTVHQNFESEFTVVRVFILDGQTYAPLCSKTESIAHEHEYNDRWVVVAEPTCEYEGYRNLYCTYCDKVGKGEVIPELGHNYSFSYDWKETAGGYSCIATRSCSRCDVVDTENASVSREYSSEATETEDGLIVYTATFKNPIFTTAAKQIVVPAHSHSVIEGTCTVCGWKYPCVTFCDYDDTILSKQYVIGASSVVHPAIPVRAGYLFQGWDKQYDNVTEDTTVKALYLSEDAMNIFSVSSAEVNEDGEVEVSVNLKGTVDLCGFDFFLTYDGEALTFVDVDDEWDLDVVANHNAATNRIRFNFSTRVNRNASAKVMTVTFRQKAASSDVTYVSLTSAPSRTSVIRLDEAGEIEPVEYHQIKGVVFLNE